MLTSDELLALARGTFVIEALHAELWSRRADAQRLLEGTARLEQDGLLGFNYILYSRENPSPDQARQLRGESGPPGEVIPEEEFLELRVLDLSSRAWTCQYVMPPGLRKPTEQPGARWYGTVTDLVAEREVYGQPARHVVVYFPGRIEVPLNTGRVETLETADGRSTHSRLTAWRVSVADVTITVTPFETYTEVAASAAGEFLPARFEWRLAEAFEFVCARRLDWFAAERFTDEAASVRLRAVTPPARDSFLGRPVNVGAIDENGHLATLLVAYLRHLWSHASDDPHPLAADVRRCHVAAESSLEALALELGIAVESTLGREFRDAAAVNDETRAAIHRALEHVQQGEGFDAIKNRVRSVIGNLASVRAPDRLYALAERGVVAQREADAWKRLRNTAAHGSTARAITEQLVLSQTVYTALLRLAFQVIGYAGPYTDYGQSGWPATTFSPAVSSPDAPLAAAADVSPGSEVSEDPGMAGDRAL